MFVSIHVVVLVLAACEEDGCWFLEMVGLKKRPLHSEDRFGVHSIALLDCYCFVVFFISLKVQIAQCGRSSTASAMTNALQGHGQRLMCGHWSIQTSACST